MRHLTEGALRRLLDEPAGVPDADRRHVADCPRCLPALAAVHEDAHLVGAALGPSEPVAAADVDAAWQRLAGAVPAAPPERHLAAVRSSRSRGLGRRPGVAALAVGVVLAGAGTAAANGWLPIFRTEQVAPVSLSSADLVALPDLSDYGDVVLTDEAELREVPDAAAAAAATGLDVPQVAALPAGVAGAPLVQVGDEVSATFTFDADRAARAAAEAGQDAPAVPPGLDGTEVRLVAGPGVAQVWESSSQVPALVVGRAVAPSAFSSGASFEAVRDHLLTLPGLPPELAAQLRAFTADGSTLPLPVPAGEATATAAEVGGAPATVLVTPDRTMAAVLWVEDGVVTVVAGSLDAEELLVVAEGLR